MATHEALKDADRAELDAVNAELARIGQHQAAGRLRAAGEMLDNLLARYPDHPRLVHLAGLNLALSGEMEAGLAQIERVLAHDPDDPVALVDYGSLLAQSGRREEAMVQFENAVEIAPNYALAHANLGAALVLEERYGPAIRHLQRACDLDGSVLDAHLNLAQAYIRVQNFDRAIDALYKALTIDPLSAAAHSNLAAALFRRERHDSGEHHARRAIELAPDNLEPWLHLGNILAAAGRMEEAAEALLKAASGPPVGAMALSRLVHLRKTREGSPEQALLTRYMARLSELPPEAQATLHFAMGKALDDLGDPAAAFEQFRLGNALTAELYPFDAGTHVARVDRLHALSTPAFQQRCSSDALTEVAPIFICGLPRSGTTLTEQMFSRHPVVRAGGELFAVNRALGNNAEIRAVLESEAADDTLGPDDFARLGEAYVTALLTEGLRAERVTDKMPANYLYVGLLAAALPRARFVIMRRHPLDGLLSNYMQNFGRNQPFSTDFAHMATVYKQFDRLARHWSALLPDRVREVSYEAIIADPGTQMRALLEFAGLDWDDAVLDHTRSSRQVNTASVAQVREPIYSSSVARWRAYAPQLRDLAEALRDHLSDEDLRACGLAGA